QTDEEAPTRLTFFDSDTVFMGMFEAAFRPQEDLSPHQLNSIVRTANRIQVDYDRDFDVLLNLGDTSDNGQFNELLVEVDVLSGTGFSSGIAGYARVDSGDLDIDPADGLNRGERNFGTQQYDVQGKVINAFARPGYPNSNADMPVEGLRRADGTSVPWMMAVGNHDVLNTGNFDVFGELNFFTAEDYTSDLAKYGLIPGLANTIRFWIMHPDQPLRIASGILGIDLNWPDLFALLDPLGMIPDDYVDDIDPRFDLFVLLHDTLDDPTDDGVVIAPDVNRAFMAHDGLLPVINELGHGFADNNNDGLVNELDGGWYSMDWDQIVPGSQAPLRLLVLDTADVPSMAVGGIGDAQLGWIDQQLKLAMADRVLVIVASHHYEGGTSTGIEELQQLLNNCPNVIAHLDGHGHKNVIIAHPSEDNDPLRGYWEIETPSTCSFPQQARILEVVDNRDGTGSLFVTLFDHWTTEGDDADVLARLGRELAFDDELTGGHSGANSFMGMGEVNDRNCELLFQIPPEVAQELTAVDNGKPLTSVESLGQRYKP
ncbi:MAG: hypothetical protein P9M14_10290, partial [Candidatus Alcyoniella australis]|nr:hypothetical protein [Candidatus Alcyoniella australis]